MADHRMFVNPGSVSIREAEDDSILLYDQTTGPLSSQVFKGRTDHRCRINLSLRSLHHMTMLAATADSKSSSTVVCPTPLCTTRSSSSEACSTLIYRYATQR